MRSTSKIFLLCSTRLFCIDITRLLLELNVVKCKIWTLKDPLTIPSPLTQQMIKTPAGRTYYIANNWKGIIRRMWGWGEIKWITDHKSPLLYRILTRPLSQEYRREVWLWMSQCSVWCDDWRDLAELCPPVTLHECLLQFSVWWWMSKLGFPMISFQNKLFWSVYNKTGDKHPWKKGIYKKKRKKEKKLFAPNFRISTVFLTLTDVAGRGRSRGSRAGCSSSSRTPWGRCTSHTGRWRTSERTGTFLSPAGSEEVARM